MKKFAAYIVLACLTAFTANSSLPVMAGGCRSHSNKTAEVNCPKEDIDCQTKKTKKFDKKETIKS